MLPMLMLVMLLVMLVEKKITDNEFKKNYTDIYDLVMMQFFVLSA
jgi:hypothetical protein